MIIQEKIVDEFEKKYIKFGSIIVVDDYHNKDILLVIKISNKCQLVSLSSDNCNIHIPAFDVKYKENSNYCEFLISNIEEMLLNYSSEIIKIYKPEEIELILG